MKRKAALVDNRRLLILLISCMLLASCASTQAPSGSTAAPTVEQLQSDARAQEQAQRQFIDQLDARLASQADQAATSELRGQLRDALEGPLSGTGANLLKIECGGALCKVEIEGGAATEANTVLVALASAHTCAMPLIELPADALGGTVSAYIDCGEEEQSLPLGEPRPEAYRRMYRQTGKSLQLPASNHVRPDFGRFGRSLFGLI